MEKNNFYVNRAIYIAEEAEKTLAAVKRYLTESRGFPIYLDDLHILVDNLMYLNVANNAVMNERHYQMQKHSFSKKKVRRKRK